MKMQTEGSILGKRCKIFFLGVLVAVMTTACASAPKMVNVKDETGKKDPIVVKYKKNTIYEIDSVSIPGGALAEKAVQVPQLERTIFCSGCTICYYDYVFNKWKFWPPSCTCPCP